MHTQPKLRDCLAKLITSPRNLRKAGLMLGHILLVSYAF